MREWARVLRPAGRAVMLINEARMPALHAAIEGSGLLLTCKRPCALGFTNAVIVVSEKRSEEGAASVMPEPGPLPWEGHGKRSDWYALRKAARSPIAPFCAREQIRGAGTRAALPAASPTVPSSVKLTHHTAQPASAAEPTAAAAEPTAAQSTAAAEPTAAQSTATLIVETLLSEARAFRSLYLFGPSGVAACFDESGALLVAGDVELGVIPASDERAAAWAAAPAAKLSALMGGYELYEGGGLMGYEAGSLLGVPQWLLLSASGWLTQRGLQQQGVVKVEGLGFVATHLRHDTKFDVQLLDMSLSAAGYIRRDWPVGFTERKYVFATPGWATYVRAEE